MDTLNPDQLAEIEKLREFLRWQDRQPTPNTLGDNGWFRVGKRDAEMLASVANIIGAMLP